MAFVPFPRFAYSSSRTVTLTLEGLVANKADKDLINVVANGVPNVFSVANDLQIANSDK